VSSGSPFAIAAFWCQKAGNAVEEYEDAWSVRRVGETAGCRVAIADGATETSYSKIWATLLVESYIRDSVTGPEFFDRLEAARRLWRQRAFRNTRPLPWYAAEKAKQGAFATFLGFELNVAGKVWRAVAIGDSCMFQLDAAKQEMRVVQAFPLSRSTEFGTSPYLVGSNPEGAATVGAHAEVCQGSLRRDDLILFATDALSAWLLRREEDRAPAWKEACESIAEQSDFEVFVQRARDDGMRNDDVTLLRVTFRG